MKATAIVLVACLLTGGTLAQTTTPDAKPSCKAQATDKKPCRRRPHQLHEEMRKRCDSSL